MMERKVTLADIAGYTTERVVWRMLQSLAGDGSENLYMGISPDDVVVKDDKIVLEPHATETDAQGKAFCAPETFSSESGYDVEAAQVWTLGALAFYALTGMNIFEGKGGQTQTKDTEVPLVSSAYASQALSSLVFRCLSFSPSERPSLGEVNGQMAEALSKSPVRRKKLTGQTGKVYASSLVKFWPEEMVTALLFGMLLLLPQGLFGQSSFGIPNDMANLVLHCVDLRSPSNTDKVRKAMERDMKWTMMDELTVDREGECKVSDMVDTFGLNEMGFSILKRHGGVTNSGGRFRDGRDPRYKYSLIEITVRKKKSVSYTISGREGEQLFAIVPYDADADFSADISGSGAETMKRDGIWYIRLRRGLTKNDKFDLRIVNKSSTKNAAFAIINFNSRNHE